MVPTTEQIYIEYRDALPLLLKTLINLKIKRYEYNSYTDTECKDLENNLIEAIVKIGNELHINKRISEVINVYNNYEINRVKFELIDENQRTITKDLRYAKAMEQYFLCPPCYAEKKISFENNKNIDEFLEPLGKLPGTTEHKKSYGAGGKTTYDNIWVLCHNHNYLKYLRYDLPQQKQFKEYGKFVPKNAQNEFYDSIKKNDIERIKNFYQEGKINIDDTSLAMIAKYGTETLFAWLSEIKNLKEEITKQLNLINTVEFGVKSYGDTTCLHIGARFGNNRLFKFLKENKVNLDVNVESELVNKSKPKMFTPLHVAVMNHQIDSVKLLLALGANIEVTDGYGETPLCKAIRNDDLDLIKFLIANKAEYDKTLVDPYFIANVYTPISIAIESRADDAFNYISELGCNFTREIGYNGKYGTTYSYLHLAARYFNLPAIQFLVKHGLDVNIKDGGDMGNNQTPLFYAAKENEYSDENKMLETVKLLIQLGADSNIKDLTGKTADEYVPINSKFDNVRKVLRQSMFR